MAESYRNWPEHQSAYALHNEFAHTNHGRVLKGASRYDLYREKAGLSHEAWQRLLGRDVNNLLHMPYTADLAAHLERRRTPENPSIVRGRKLKAAIGHDNGEAITGDILYIHKTDNHFSIEKEAFLGHITEFYASPDTQTEMAEIAENIIFNDESEEGREFNMVEQLGYLQTSLKAWAVIRHGNAESRAGIEEGTLTDEDKVAILGITASVLGSTLDKTLGYYDSGTNPEFNQFINNRRHLMLEAFEDLPVEAFDIFEDRKQERIEAFQTAKQEWALRFNQLNTVEAA